MRIRVDGNKTIETDNLTLDELRGLKLRADNASDIIQRQIDLAKAEKINTGNYADPTWYANANYSLRQMRKTANRLQELIGIRARQARQEERSFADHFVDVCRELMTERTFAEFWAEAERRKYAKEVATP